MQHGSVSHGVDLGAKKRHLSDSSAAGELHVAKKNEAEGVILQLRCRDFAKIRPPTVSSEIPEFVGIDYKITPLRDSMKLECSEVAAKLVQKLNQLDCKELVVGRFEEKVVVKGVVHGIEIGEEEVVKGDFSMESSS